MRRLRKLTKGEKRDIVAGGIEKLKKLYGSHAPREYRRALTAKPMYVLSDRYRSMCDAYGWEREFFFSDERPEKKAFPAEKAEEITSGVPESEKMRMLAELALERLVDVKAMVYSLMKHLENMGEQK